MAERHAIPPPFNNILSQFRISIYVNVELFIALLRQDLLGRYKR